MVKTINVGYYFVAFIDIVGQRDRLKQWVKLPSNEDENKNVAHILRDTSEYVRELRVKFDEYFEAVAKPTGGTVVECGHGLPPHHDATAGGLIQATEKIEEGRLSRA